MHVYGLCHRGNMQTPHRKADRNQRIQKKRSFCDMYELSTISPDSIGALS